MKVSLVLSGGAARGTFHLGVLSYLDEVGIEVEAISGSSIGSIIGACYSAGISPKEQLEIFKSKEFKKTIKFNYFKNGIFKIDQENNILKQLAPIKKIEDLKIPLYVTAVDLISGKVVVFDKGEVLPICLGSSALTPIFKPVSYENYQLVDGGLIDNFPIEPLKKYDSKIVGINLHPFQNYQPTTTLWQTLKRTYKLMAFHSVSRSILECDIYITSKKLSNYGLFKFENLDEMYHLGYEKAKETFSKYL